MKLETNIRCRSATRTRFHGVSLGAVGLPHTNWMKLFSCCLLVQRVVFWSGISLSLCRCLSVSRSDGWVGSCVEEPGDWQLHMCLCNYGRANWQRGTLGHCHYWHTSTTPNTCRWRERLPTSHGEGWRDGGKECLCATGERDGGTAVKTGRMYI